MYVGSGINNTGSKEDDGLNVTDVEKNSCIEDNSLNVSDVEKDSCIADDSLNVSDVDKDSCIGKDDSLNVTDVEKDSCIGKDDSLNVTDVEKDSCIEDNSLNVTDVEKASCIGKDDSLNVTDVRKDSCIGKDDSLNVTDVGKDSCIGKDDSLNVTDVGKDSCIGKDDSLNVTDVGKDSCIGKDDSLNVTDVGKDSCIGKDDSLNVTDIEKDSCIEDDSLNVTDVEKDSCIGEDERTNMVFANPVSTAAINTKEKSTFLDENQKKIDIEQANRYKIDIVGNDYRDNTINGNIGITEADTWSFDSEYDSETSISSSTSVSSSSSDESDNNKPRTDQRNKIAKVTVKPKTKGEVELEDLPVIEDLHITVPESDIQQIGKVISIVESLVVVESFEMQALDMDSVLFLSHNKPLGQIYDVFGPVSKPLYSVRFNNAEEILKKDVSKGAAIYFAPSHSNITSYVLTDNLRSQKGSDASWKHNNEPPEEFLDFSDDEDERKARMKRRAKNRKKSLDTDNTDIIFQSQFRGASPRFHTPLRNVSYKNELDTNSSPVIRPRVFHHDVCGVQHGSLSQLHGVNRHHRLVSQGPATFNETGQNRPFQPPFIQQQRHPVPHQIRPVGPPRAPSPSLYVPGHQLQEQQVHPIVHQPTYQVPSLSVQKRENGFLQPRYSVAHSNRPRESFITSPPPPIFDPPRHLLQQQQVKPIINQNVHRPLIFDPRHPLQQQQVNPIVNQNVHQPPIFDPRHPLQQQQVNPIVNQNVHQPPIFDPPRHSLQQQQVNPIVNQNVHRPPIFDPPRHSLQQQQVNPIVNQNVHRPPVFDPPRHSLQQQQVNPIVNQNVHRPPVFDPPRHTLQQQQVNPIVNQNVHRPPIFDSPRHQLQQQQVKPIINQNVHRPLIFDPRHPLQQQQVNPIINQNVHRPPILFGHPGASAMYHQQEMHRIEHPNLNQESSGLFQSNDFPQQNHPVPCQIDLRTMPPPHTFHQPRQQIQEEEVQPVLNQNVPQSHSSLFQPKLNDFQQQRYPVAHQIGRISTPMASPIFQPPRESQQQPVYPIIKPNIHQAPPFSFQAQLNGQRSPFAPNSCPVSPLSQTWAGPL